jgi:predicted RNase H-like nuclease (RuvC/YqgF family)
MTVKERELVGRISELEEKLAASVPRAEFETVKANLQLEMDDLERRLSDSVPRADLEYVKNELQRNYDLQGKYSDRSMETQELTARIVELEKLLRTTPGNSTEPRSGLAAATIPTQESELQEAS